MIKRIIQGNIMDSKDNIIAHQVNCAGIMGAQVSRLVKLTYPNVYAEYSKLTSKTKKLLGTCQLVPVKKDKYIANIFGQYAYGFSPATTTTDLEALSIAIEDLAEFATKNNYSISIPIKMGVGMGMDEWNKVLEIIGTHTAKLEVNIYIPVANIDISKP